MAGNAQIIRGEFMNLQKWIDKELKSECKEIVSKLVEKIKISYDILGRSIYQQESEAEHQNSFGEFSETMLDTDKLREVLYRVKNKSAMNPDRKRGIQRAREILKKYQNNSSLLPIAGFMEFNWQKDPASFLREIENYYSQFAELFFAFRIADFEHNASFGKHQEMYKKDKLDFYNITRQEWSMVIPLIVWEAFAELDPVKMLPILTEIASRPYPVKLVVLETHPFLPGKDIDIEEYIESLIPTDLALLVPGLQKIHYFQAPAETDSKILSQKLLKIWKESGSSLIRLYDGSDKKHLNRAAMGRYVPFFEYNPHIDFNLASCVSLDGNFNVEELWGRDNFTEDISKEERIITFADFVFQEGQHLEHFSFPVMSDKRRPLELDRYLELEKWNRTHYYPIVKDVYGKAMVPSPLMVALSAERARIWRTLQNWAGIANPIIDSRIKLMKEELQKQKELALKELEAKLLQEKEREKEELLTTAFQNLVVNLLSEGVEGGLENILSSLGDLTAQVPTTPKPTNNKPTVSQANKVEKPASDLPWVESKSCTACDECITINRNIFAYNSDKQAYIKNPKGGLYRDIVKAAEKCSAGIIHPGVPQDSSEKDLDKLTKRAEKFR